MAAIVNKLQWWVAEAIKDTQSKFFGVSAGLGSGKSHGAAQWHYHRCKINVGSPRSCIMMPTYQKIWDTAVPTIEKVYQSMGMVENVHYSIVKQPHPMIKLLPIKHDIHMLSANNPDKIVGVEYSHAWISEAGILKPEAIDNIRDRVRTPSVVKNQLLFEGVPQGIGKYAEMFDTEQQAGWHEIAPKDYRRMVKTPKTDILYRRFRVSTYDNPYLPDDYIGGLYDTYRNRANYIKAYIHGYFVPLHVGNVYTDYMAEVHNIKPIPPTGSHPVYLTWDFNANPVSWVAIQNKTFSEYDKIVSRYVAIAECKKGINQLADAVAYFSARFPVEQFGNSEICIYGDMSGHHRSHKITGTDYDVIKKHLVRLGYQRVFICALKHNPLETVSVEYLNAMFRRDELYICKDLKELQRSLLFTRWKDTTKNIDKPSGEDWTHYSDALKYFAYALNYNKNNRVSSTNEILSTAKLR